MPSPVVMGVKEVICSSHVSASYIDDCPLSLRTEYAGLLVDVRPSLSISGSLVVNGVRRR